MKKFLAAALSLLFVLALPLSALAEKATLPGGTIEGDTYTNTDGGFSFTAPAGWTYDTAEALAKTNGVAEADLLNEEFVAGLLAEGKDVTVMNVSDGGNGIPCSITVTCKAIDEETAAAIAEMGEEAFLEDSLEMSDASFSGNGVTVKNMKAGSATFLGKKAPMVEFTLKFALVISRQVNMVICVRGDRIYTVVVVSKGDGLQYLDLFQECAA